MCDNIIDLKWKKPMDWSNMQPNLILSAISLGENLEQIKLIIKQDKPQ